MIPLSGLPQENGLLPSSYGVKVMSGAHSVIPKPTDIGNLIRYRNASTSGFNGAPPMIICLNSPPKACTSCSRIFEQITSSKNGTLSTQLTGGFWICGTIIFLYIFSRIKGTDRIIVGFTSENAFSSIFGDGVRPTNHV